MTRLLLLVLMMQAFACRPVGEDIEELGLSVEPGAEGFTVMIGEKLVGRVDLLEASRPAERIASSVNENLYEWSLGTASFTAQVIPVDETLVALHFRTYMPGALGLRAVLDAEETQLIGRRLLKANLDEGTVKLWVFPMESDVEPEDRQILLRGEGEALVVVALGDRGNAQMVRLGVEEDRVDDVMALLGKLTELAETD